MDSQTILLIVAYFAAGWLLGGFAFAAPHIIKSLRDRQIDRQNRDRLYDRRDGLARTIPDREE